MLITRCTFCLWEGSQTELITKKDCYESDLEVCPRCKSEKYLQDDELKNIHDAINNMWNI